MKDLLKDIRSCTFCEKNLPLGAKPIVRFNQNTKILLISQAPGRAVHNTGIDWNDPSGRKLREWLGVTDEQFYNTDNFGVMPMGFCYPGKAKTGDLPPRKECAPLWHKSILDAFKQQPLKILIGAHACKYYLGAKKNLTQQVENFKEYLPQYLPLPHPSPVNRFWRSKNPWFEKEAIPNIRQYIQHKVL